MEDIRKIFTIQWVGPFHSFEKMKEYLNDEETCEKTLFSFYYCSGSKLGKGHPSTKKDYRYFGLHKASSPISSRVNRTHERLSQFKEFSLWIGSFSDYRQQKPQNIEDVETLFISTYADYLTENDRKKKSSPDSSICIINLWYKATEERWSCKKMETQIFDDVLVYEKDTDTYSTGKLSVIK